MTFVPTDSTKISAPRSACRELLLTIVQDLPPSLIEPDTLSKMCHLVTDTAESVQRMAYQVLQGAAAKRTEHLVIESAVDTEDEFKAELPAELLELLSRLVDPEDAEQDEQVCRVVRKKEGRALTICRASSAIFSLGCLRSICSRARYVMREYITISHTDAFG